MRAVSCLGRAPASSAARVVARDEQPRRRAGSTQVFHPQLLLQGSLSHNTSNENNAADAKSCKALSAHQQRPE